MLTKHQEKKEQDRYNTSSIFALFDIISETIIGKKTAIPELKEVNENQYSFYTDDTKANQLSRLFYWRITSGQI